MQKLKSDLKSQYIQRIDRLFARLNKATKQEELEAAFAGTLTLMISIYGPNSPHMKSLFDTKKNSPILSEYDVSMVTNTLKSALRGILINLKEEIKDGLVLKLENEVAGEVLGDFVALAKQQLKAGYKNVAAVLVSAAMEDALKRKAEELGINVIDKNMSTVINALKSKSFFKGTQGAIVTSYTQLRNAAMHADWDAIQEADVNGLIGFLESFLLENFS